MRCHPWQRWRPDRPPSATPGRAREGRGDRSLTLSRWLRRPIVSSERVSLAHVRGVRLDAARAEVGEQQSRIARAGEAHAAALQRQLDGAGTACERPKIGLSCDRPCPPDRVAAAAARSDERDGSAGAAAQPAPGPAPVLVLSNAGHREPKNALGGRPRHRKCPSPAPIAPCAATCRLRRLLVLWPAPPCCRSSSRSSTTPEKGVTKPRHRSLPDDGSAASRSAATASLPRRRAQQGSRTAGGMRHRRVRGAGSGPD